MIIKFDIPEWGDEKTITKFLWFPLYFEGKLYWLENVELTYYSQVNYVFFEGDYHWVIGELKVLGKTS